jgi:APA family basic amino acid/polyamine antiporter
LFNLPAFLAIAFLTALLIVGIRETARFNVAIVLVKVAVVLVFIAAGAGFVVTANWHPFIPENTGDFGHFGLSGVLRGAAVVFFAYIGFDAVSTAAQEAKRPQRDMPIGILGSLVLCTLLYVLFSYVLSGVATIQDFRSHGREASVAFAISTYMHGYEWLSKSVTVAILAGFSSVILVMLLGQSRVFFTMSQDGLVPRVFSEVHPKYRTPYKSNLLFFVFTALFAAFIPEDIVGEMTSIGTLFAFILVCIGVWIMRVRRPDVPRGFVVPALPVMSILGIMVCSAMIHGLGWTNWLRLIVWLAIGLVIYFSYGRHHSRLER